MAGDARGSSATCSGVLVGLELQLHHGVQSNSAPKCPANPVGVRGQGCVLAAVRFSFCDLFLCLFLFFCLDCLVDFPPPLHKPWPPPQPATNRLNFLLLKTGFPGVERLNSQKRPLGGWLF